MVLTVWTYITGLMVLLDIGDEIVRRQGRMVFFFCLEEGVAILWIDR